MSQHASRGANPLWGLAALALGLALGSLFPEALAWIGAGVKSAFGFLAKAAPYIIFFTLVPAILVMLSTGSAGRFALYATVAFVGTTALAGLLAAVALTFLFQLDLVASGGNVGAALAAVGPQTAQLAKTSPPFIAIWYSGLVALFLHFGARARVLEWFCRPTADVIRAVGVSGVERLGRGIQLAFPFILLTIGVYLPSGVGDAIKAGAETLGSTDGLAGLGGTSPIAWYIITVVVMVAILAVLVFGGAWLVCGYTGFSFRRFFNDYFLYVYPFAWATASSTATVPINLERAKEGLGARKEVRYFLIPLGATVNLDGTTVGVFVLTVVGGILVGYTPTALDLLILVVPLTVVSIGIPGIPGGSAAVAPPVIASILPFPPGSEAAFFAIFFAFGVGLTDQFRSGVNSVNNGILCILFEYWYPRKFEKTAAPEAPAALEVPPP